MYIPATYIFFCRPIRKSKSGMRRFRRALLDAEKTEGRRLTGLRRAFNSVLRGGNDFSDKCEEKGGTPYKNGCKCPDGRFINPYSDTCRSGKRAAAPTPAPRRKRPKRDENAPFCKICQHSHLITTACRICGHVYEIKPEQYKADRDKLKAQTFVPDERFHLKIPHYDEYFGNFMFFSKHAEDVVEGTKAQLAAIVKYLEELRQSVVDQIHAFREEEDEQLRKEAKKLATKQMIKHIREKWKNTEFEEIVKPDSFDSFSPMKWMNNQANAIYDEKRKEAILIFERNLFEEASKQHNAAVADIVRILEGFESVAGDMIQLAERDRRQQNRK